PAELSCGCKLAPCRYGELAIAHLLAKPRQSAQGRESRVPRRCATVNPTALHKRRAGECFAWLVPKENLMTDLKHSVSQEVEGKVALVTGAASGIGKAIAQLLHARGAKVVAEDLNPDVESLAQPGLVPLVADITADGAAERAVGLAVEQFGRLDILVNNAGIIIN